MEGFDVRHELALDFPDLGAQHRLAGHAPGNEGKQQGNGRHGHQCPVKLVLQQAQHQGYAGKDEEQRKRDGDCHPGYQATYGIAGNVHRFRAEQIQVIADMGHDQIGLLDHDLEKGVKHGIACSEMGRPYPGGMKKPQRVRTETCGSRLRRSHGKRQGQLYNLPGGRPEPAFPADADQRSRPRSIISRAAVAAPTPAAMAIDFRGCSST